MAPAPARARTATAIWRDPWRVVGRDTFTGDLLARAGLPDVFAHGMLSFGVLSRVVTRWAGAERLRGFGARFVSITQVHDLIACQGRVSEIIDEEGERRARIEVSATAQDGRQTLIGEAWVSLA